MIRLRLSMDKHGSRMRKKKKIRKSIVTVKEGKDNDAFGGKKTENCHSLTFPRNGDFRKIGQSKRREEDFLLYQFKK